MKKFAIALLALATSLAITPAAMASTLCSADSSAITAGTSCYEGIFTFTFDTVSIVGSAPLDSLYFNTGTTGFSSSGATLGFQVVGSSSDDFNLVYEVQGPVGEYVLDNNLGGAGSITEFACPPTLLSAPKPIRRPSFQPEHSMLTKTSATLHTHSASLLTA
jgi:hypothetical protein